MFKNTMIGFIGLVFILITNVNADDYGNSTSAAASINVNTGIAGKVSFGGDNDYFKFTLARSGTLTLYTTGSTDTYGYLLNENGSTIKSNDDSGASRNFRISTNVAAGTYYIRLRGYSWFTSGSYVLSTSFVADKDPKQNIVLLLHGLSSNADTWTDLVDRTYNGNCPILTSTDSVSATPYTSATKCYRMNFGTNDYMSIQGLEDQYCSSTSGCSGDFANYDALGSEVKDTVSNLLDAYADGINVILVGHSRGSLAARAFLQEPSSSAQKDAISGLITTATPHKGSPLGRMYNYMRETCFPRSQFSNDNGECEDDWEVVDLFLGTRYYIDPFVDGVILDLTTPSIKFLSPESDEIRALNNEAYMLNSLNVEYTQMVYVGYELGDLVDGYNLFSFSIGDKPSNSAENIILQGNSAESYDGDSIVPSESQKFDKTQFTAQDARHTDETGRVTDLAGQINAMSIRLGWNN